MERQLLCEHHLVFSKALEAKSSQDDRHVFCRQSTDLIESNS